MLLGEYLGNLRIKFQACQSSQRQEDRDFSEMALEAPLPQEADGQEGGDTLRKGAGDVLEATVPSADFMGSTGWNHAQLSRVVTSRMKQTRVTQGSDMHPQRPGWELGLTPWANAKWGRWWAVVSGRGGLDILEGAWSRE